MLIISFLVICKTLLFLYWKFNHKKYKLPPGPSGIPILGYLPFLGPEPYRTLDKLKGKYGNVFSLYLGRSFVVILGDNDAMKDAFSQSATTDRPSKLFDAIPDGVGLSSLNGVEWSEQRKFCVKSMRNFGLGKYKWESLIQEEVEDFVELVSTYNGQDIKITQVLSSSVMNNISSFIFGHRLPLNSDLRRNLDETMEAVMMSLNQTGISNFFPIIRDICIALNIGEAARMHCILRNFNRFIRDEVQRIKTLHRNEENFIVDYLNQMDELKDKQDHFFNDTNLHGNIQALFIAGSDTTRTSLEWLFLIMAAYPNIQTKVQEEIDMVMEEIGRIQWQDRYALPYTLAVIMEGQRWRTLAPLNTTRLVKEDIRIQGYDIPKGVSIIANTWGIHHDKKYWENPEHFKPERFLTANGQLRTNLESYMPFTYGKRNCPGESVAMMEIVHYFVALMKRFRIEPPRNKKLIMDGILGLIYLPVKQELVFNLRK